MRHLAMLFLLCGFVAGQASGQSSAGSPTPAGPTTASSPSIDCTYPYFEDSSICEIDLEDLQQMEKTGTHPAIKVKKGDTVTWQWRHHPQKFKFDPFVQVDCDTGKPNHGSARRPFMNKFDDDDKEDFKWSTVSPNAEEGTCFKHVITVEGAPPIDPHVIIGPSTGLEHRKLGNPERIEEGNEGKPHIADKYPSGRIDPSTCLHEGTCQKCPEAKSKSLCEISTAWLRQDGSARHHLPVLLLQNQEVIWYTPVDYATIDVGEPSQVSCLDERQVIRKNVKNVFKMKSRTPAAAQTGIIGGTVGTCYKHNIKGSGGEETGVDPHVIIGPGLQ